MKWRKFKKVFNKKIKPRMVGLKVAVNGAYGVMGTIKDVKVCPAGGRSVSYECTVVPDAEPIWAQCQPVIDEYERERENSGFSISCDVSVPKNAELSNLLSL